MNKKAMDSFGTYLATFGIVWITMFIIDEIRKRDIVWLPGDTVLFVGFLTVIFGLVFIAIANFAER